MHFDRVAVWRAGKVFRRVREIDERVEALVHPRIQSLVRPDDHWEPLVAELVGNDPLLILTGRTVRREGQHWILHALDWTFDGGRMRVGISEPLLGVVLDRLPTHPVDFAPLVRLRAIQVLDENSIIATGV